MIMGEDWFETKRGLIDGPGDGGASIITKTFDAQPSTFNSSLPKTPLLKHSLLISRRINDVEQHGEEKITNQDSEGRVHD
ncbi:MAG: hypothetical protein ACREIW_04990, partial [Chthoniobacterales bacterium]